MLIRILITTMLSATLFGCAIKDYPNYAVAEGAATANIRSVIPGPNNPPSYFEDIFIFASEGTCSHEPYKGVLFEINYDKSKTTPDGYVKVAANRPLRIKYVELAPGNICSGEYEVTLEEGKSYTLFGGPYYKKELDTWRCRSGFLDDATQNIVPAKPCP